MYGFREIPFRNRPTDRQKVISERYAEIIKEETGIVVDPETVRAVRYSVLRHSERAIFKNDAELYRLTAYARRDRKRARAMNLLHDAERELSSLIGNLEDDSDDPFGDDDETFGDDDNA